MSHGTSWLNRRVLTICIVESAERFSYYGTSFQLALFLSSGPASFPPSLASSSVSLFTSLAYLTPLLGANLASRHGMYSTILSLGLIYLLGALLLPISALPSPISLPLTLLSLLLLAFGTGGIKPNVAAFGALQIADSPTGHDDPRLTSFFTAFYFVINAGAIFGQLAVPAIQKTAGYALSFTASFFVLLFSLLVFMLGNVYPGYIHEAPKAADQTVDTPAELVRVAIVTRLGVRWNHIPPDKAARLAIAVRSLRLLVPVTLFWTGYMAMSSTWLLQVNRMTLPLGLSASQWSALNPIVVLITLPLSSAVFTRIGVFSEARIALGMALGAVALFLSVIVQRWVDAGDVSGLWTLPQWIVLSVAEVLASVSSLELAHKGAPEELKSAMQAGWLLVTAGGSALAAVVFAAVKGMEQALMMLAVLMVIGVGGFIVAWRAFGKELGEEPLLEDEREDDERSDEMGLTGR